MSDTLELLYKRMAGMHGLTPTYDEWLQRRSAEEIKRLRALEEEIRELTKEAERLRGHLQIIQGFATDPAFESDVMGWIASECRFAFDPEWLDRIAK